MHSVPLRNRNFCANFARWAKPFLRFKTQDVWKDLDMWKLMTQINYAIRNNLKWKKLDYIDYNPEMVEELKKRLILTSQNAGRYF